MDIQVSEKRKFLELTREYVLYDILKQEDIRWLFVYISRKTGTLMILGSFTEDSRKSLSPVRKRSAPALSAARKMGRSFIT